MADTAIPGLTELTGANVAIADDLLLIEDSSVTTTKYIKAQEFFNVASKLTALTGANVEDAADSIPIYDNSVTTTKRILVSELLIALGALAAGVQADQETATSNAVAVTPGVQQYHPSAGKAWGLATLPATITLSYPAAGSSLVSNGSGSYTITHGVTFSTANYAVVVTPLSSTDVVAYITARNATTFTVKFVDFAGSAATPTSFSYSCFGDL